MTFLVQFIRFRRGVPQVIRTVPIAAADGMAALERVKGHVGMGSWPMHTDALRVMDDGGRTVLDWIVPAPAGQPPTSSELPQRMRVEPDLRAADHKASEDLPQDRREAPAIPHPLDVGQAVSYTEDGKPEDWKGGFQIVGLSDPGAGEAQYVIRSANQSSNRTVKEHELQEDLGERTRGQ
jgi:hypothetical protein